MSAAYIQVRYTLDFFMLFSSDTLTDESHHSQKTPIRPEKVYYLILILTHIFQNYGHLIPMNIFSLTPPPPPPQSWMQTQHI